MAGAATSPQPTESRKRQRDGRADADDAAREAGDRRARAAAEPPLVLNVGGKTFHTTRQTLCSIPESMLARRFAAENAEMNAPLADGSHFIDRDPAAFRHVLNGLRRGSIAADRVPAGLEISLEDWRAELDFYGLVAPASSEPAVASAGDDDSSRASAASELAAGDRLQLRRRAIVRGIVQWLAESLPVAQAIQTGGRKAEVRLDESAVVPVEGEPALSIQKWICANVLPFEWADREAFCRQCADLLGASNMELQSLSRRGCKSPQIYDEVLQADGKSYKPDGVDARTHSILVVTIHF